MNSLTILGILIVLIPRSISLTTSNFTFETAGFKECVFNLVFADSMSETVDMVENTVVPNSEIQPWVILQISNRTKRSLWSPPAYLKEVCSINVLIESGCSTLTFIDIFVSRLYNSRSFLYIIHRVRPNCPDGQWVAFQTGRRIVSDLVQLYVTQNGHGFRMALFRYPSCKVINSIQIPFPNYTNLLEARKTSELYTAKHEVPTIATFSHYSSSYWKPLSWSKFLYKQRQSTNPRSIGIVSNHILIENVATALNYSTEFFSSNHVERFLHHSTYLPKQYAAIAILGLLDWYIWHQSHSSEYLFKQILNERQTFRFFYCTETETLEGFNYLFWTAPFDERSWAVLGLSLLLLTWILKGQWFELFSILMRQECRILKGRKKLLIAFIFATIVFTYGYEGVISSLLTVPPPLLVYDKLKDLLEAGYKIRLSANESKAQYIPIFNAENITGTVDSRGFEIPEPLGINFTLRKTILTHCNLTTSLNPRAFKQYKFYIRNIQSKLSCKFVRDTKSYNNYVFQFIGTNLLKVARATVMIIQSGILEWYTKFFDYVAEDLKQGLDMELMEYGEMIPKPFEMINPKIMSIFVLWAALLALSTLAFVIEIHTLYVHLVVQSDLPFLQAVFCIILCTFIKFN